MYDIGRLRVNIDLSAYFYHEIPSTALRQPLWLGLTQA
jgi:hypothetical protein